MNAKITALTALTSPAASDVLPVVDVSDTSMAASGTTKKMTLTQAGVPLAPSGDTTGVTDYAAINAVTSVAGGVARLRPGTWYLSQMLVTANNTAILGAGAGATVIQNGSSFSTASAALISTATTAQNCLFRDFTLQVGQSSSGSSHGLDLVSVAGQPVTLHRVDNVAVYYAGQDGFHLGAAVIESHISNCFAYGCQRSGFYTEVSATDNKITGCSSAQSASHGYWILGNTTHLTACKSYYSGFISGTSGTSTANWNDANGFNLAPAAGQSLSRVWLDSCEAQNNGTNGFFLDGSASSAQLDHCTLVNCASDGDNVGNHLGCGFKVYRALTTTFTNCNTNIGTNSTSTPLNFGAAIFSTLTGTTWSNCHWEGNAGAVYTDGTVAGTWKMTSCTGYNPVGKIGSPPAVAATGVAVTNTTGVDAMVIVTNAAAATATSVSIGGQATGVTSSVSSAVQHPVRVPAGQTITLTYTNAPTWTWWGD